MRKIGTAFAYTDAADRPVLSTVHEFEPEEMEVLEVVSLSMVEEGLTRSTAGALALSALHNPEPSFVEWLTCGVFTLDPEGTLIADVDTMRWLRKIKEGR